MRIEAAWIAVVMAAIAVAGCGGDNPEPKNEGDANATQEAEVPKKKSGFGMQQELGELDEKKTTATFDQVSSKLQQCFSKGVERLPFLSGDVHLVVRITEAGNAKWAFVKESTLGDRQTEDCMLAILKSASWPKPQGGEGIAEKGLTFDPGGDERPPISWTPERLGPALGKAKSALSSCKGGSASMSVTMYVGTDGKAQGVGVASGDEKGEQAAGCVVSALHGVSFPSPGSWPAKVTFSVP